MGKLRRTFVDPFQVEKLGHVGSFWSSEDESSFMECSCGHAEVDADALVVFDSWRSHVARAVGR